ncbi:unnamed protein product, partial [Dovyalis caffra]
RIAKIDHARAKGIFISMMSLLPRYFHSLSEILAKLEEELARILLSMLVDVILLEIERGKPSEEERDGGHS